MAQTFLFSSRDGGYEMLCHTGSELAESGSVFVFYTVDALFADGDRKVDLLVGVGPAASKALVLEMDDPLPEEGFPRGLFLPFLSQR